MSNWIAWKDYQPAIMQTVLTHYNGKVGTDWVDSEMLRDAENGKKPVTEWMVMPRGPIMTQLELDLWGWED